MSNVPVEAFFILIGLAIAGLIAWLVVAYLRTPQEAGEAGENAPGRHRVRPDADPNVLAIRTDEQGLWEVSVYGVPYRSLEAVPDPDAQQKVADALRILAGFSRSYIQRRQTQPSSANLSGLDTTDGMPAVPGAALRELTQPRPATASAFVPQVNLAREIGDIVEELQARTPSLANNTIRLQNAAGGGVVFIVDGRIYRNLADIPNEEVKTLIRAATRQWEMR